MFTDLEEGEAAIEASSSTATSSASSDEEDARVIDEVSSLFSELEQEWHVTETDSSSTSSEPSAEDWTAALDVDDVSTLFSELEALERTAEAPVSRAVPVETPRAVDPRIFVPSFSIRMDGVPAVKLSGASTSHLLVGPPSLLSGPPPLRPGVANPATDKRKARPTAPRVTSEEISETRRACAAKRRRVNGRFTAEKCAFVPITALQP
ncbi:hypothetical protein PINS_up023770 [Pythium insidiosum]|nr:hypothetical protein PINS_up019773 [Pythium insidiosum]GLE08657.1 hypothetical protein PINS_up019972 [Pythium insidiosum]GLE11383.1 hypothetical protein PINS_up023770 [Pythium insidiosum]